MRRRALFAAAAAIGSPQAARAAGPLLKVERWIAIAAPPGQVWRIIGNFGDCGWMPHVTSSWASNGNTIGSVRTTTAKGVIATERLIDYSNEHMTYTYELIGLTGNTEAVPFTSYSATLELRPARDGSTVVVWRGGFRRIDPNVAPLPGRDDQAAIDAVSDIYDLGLRTLKSRAEQSR